ncbi:histidinol dehydrogenase [Halomonadaceae bacterium KBTZ08]
MSELSITRLNTADSDFDAALRRHTEWEEGVDTRVRETVADILHRVRKEGDAAVLAYTATLDNLQVAAVSELEVARERIDAAMHAITDDQFQALETAADRIRRYHREQLPGDWFYEEADGTRLGQRVLPVDRAGLYVPGGKAAYPSSVLMNAIPAKVAGVAEIVMVVPAPGGELNDLVLAAARVAGIDRIYTLGGAQAVAALAYGTETVPAVDKIVGPGNIYVAEAKREVFGRVGIDMVAGPSEILVIADGHTDPDWVAMDLFSQAEHDEQAQAILVSPDADYIARVEASMARMLPEMERADIIRQSLADRGMLIQCASLEEAARVSNRVAPEHLELSLADPDALLGEIRHAGAIFMGSWAAEVMGDYCAGPNHVLPTSGTARFSSPLGVYDFQKRSSVVHFSAAGADRAARCASVLAQGEGLTAHARSAEYRIRD